MFLGPLLLDDLLAPCEKDFLAASSRREAAHLEVLRGTAMRTSPCLVEMTYFFVPG